jgi:hypothetical protein
MRANLIVVLTAGALLAVPSARADIVESEPNNSFATADPIARGAVPWSDVGIMTLGGSGGDLDFFSIFLDVGEVITVVTTPLDNPDFTDPDTVLGFFDPGGGLIVSDDDGGPGLGSAVGHVAAFAGTYFIGVTGFPDFGFAGGHTESGRYALTVSIVPAPGALSMLLALGVAGVGRRRRR